MKRLWPILVIVLAMAFSSEVLAETSYFCINGSTISSKYPIKVSASGGATWCATCRLANGTQSVGEFLLRTYDPLPSFTITIPPSSFNLMVTNSAISSSLYRTSNSVRATISYPCCRGVVSWQAQLYAVLPAGTFVTGRRYQISFCYSQTIPSGSAVLEGQQHYSPYNPLGLWEYINYPADNIVRSFTSAIFVAKSCPGTQRLDIGLAGNVGPIASKSFTLVGNVVIKQMP